MLLTVYTSYFVVYAVMDFSSLVYAAFLICGFVRCICYVRSVFGLTLFFSLCERIFDCCLRSFALARATKRTKLKSKPSIALKNPAALERLANFLVSGAGLWVLCA